MILRAATTGDVPAIAKIMGDWCADTPYIPALHTREEDRAFIARVVDTQEVTVADIDGVVQGFAARDGDELNQLYLAPSARGRGLGSQLIDLMKSHTQTLALWCFQANTGARRFYERHGFKIEKMTDGEGNEERLPDIRYVWSAV